MDPLYLFIQRFLGAIIGIFLFISVYRLFKSLENKEIALSMVFLQKNRIINLFGVLIIAGSLTFLTGIVFVFYGNSIIVEILLDLNAFTLLIFTFLLQKLLKGEDSKWI